MIKEICIFYDSLLLTLINIRMYYHLMLLCIDNNMLCYYVYITCIFIILGMDNNMQIIQ